MICASSPPPHPDPAEIGNIVMSKKETKQGKKKENETKRKFPI